MEAIKSWYIKNINTRVSKQQRRDILQERIIWVDNLKSFGILAVVLGHITSPLGYFIYSWHMPLFFFLAGFFLKFELSLKEFIKKDTKRLMIPYFIFAIFALVVESLKRVALNREKLEYLDEIKGIFIWMDYSSLINTYGFVLWFLPALFFSRLTIFLLNKIIKSELTQVILILSIFYSSFYFNFIFAIDNAFNAVLFIFLGSIFYRHYQNIMKLNFLTFILIAIIYYFDIPILHVASKNYENFFINVFYAMSVIFILISVMKKISLKSQLISLWANNTMLIFIIHPYTNNIGHIITETLFYGEWYYKFFISLIILQGLLLIKKRFTNRGIFQYV